MADILVVEDEEVLARSIVSFLERRGFSAAFAVDTKTAEVMFARERPRLVILDYRLGRENGLELLSRMRATRPEAQIIVMTGHGDVGVAVEAMKRGARDFLAKPAPLATIAAIASELMLDDVRRPADGVGLDRLVGRSSVALDLKAAIRRLAQVAEGEDPPCCVISGPRGAGKAMIARALHEAARKGAGFGVVVDCSLDPAGLEEALGQVPESLLLRHVEALDVGAQTLLARALAEGTAPWVIATSSRNLAVLERQGAFRPDLLYRLQVGWIEVPALAERSSDVLPLAEHFARAAAQRAGRPRLRFTPEARAALVAHDWPGNIAELENCITRAVINAADAEITEGDVRIMRPTEPAASAVPNLTQFEEHALIKALRVTGGNVSRAAEMLGISRDTMRYRMEKYGISRR